MVRHGQTVPGQSVRPSKRLRKEQSQFHSAVDSTKAQVHGCVVFTNDQFFHTYLLAPNDNLTRSFPCFSARNPDMRIEFPKYFRERLSKPNQPFAREFVAGRL